MRKNHLLILITSLLAITFSSCSTNNPEPDLFNGYEINNEHAVRPTSGIQQISIYGINDFHGAIKEDGYQMGLGYLGSFMKQRMLEQNSLFIDSGDTWQGSLESNYNRGKLINEVFENAKLSAKTVGNHDFDWGTDVLADNVKNSKIPNLAANVFDYTWSTKKMGNKQQEQFGKSYATYVLDNGLKVGIIGTIGEDQITSICTPLVQNIAFAEQTQKIKDISDFLRTKKNCDVIIASSHSSFDQMDSISLTKVSSVSNKRYVDLVLNAHTHQKESYKINDVYFAQFGGYGEVIGEIKMYYNFSTNQLVDSSTNITSYSSYQVKQELSYTVDTEIQSIIDRYDAQTKDIGSQVLSEKFDGSFYSSEQLPNLMTEAIALEAEKEGFSVDFAYTNVARASHYSTEITYSDLYNIFPFDNAVPVIKVSGKDACNMLRYRNNIYKVTPSISINYNDTYTVACIDYLAFHCDENRNYDSFPNLEIVGYLKKDNKDYYYREILKDYLLANPEKSFESSYYSFTNPIFSREGSYF